MVQLVATESTTPPPKFARHACVDCGQQFPPGFNTVCPGCDGMIDVTYDLSNVRLVPSDDSLERYFNLLPVSQAVHFHSHVSYPTPCVHARRLGAAVGLPELFLKNETACPTGTTKDRMAAVALAFLWEGGVRSFCTSSTGNSSTAYAHAVRHYPDMKIYVFTAESFVSRVQHADHPQVVHFGLRDATFVEAFAAAGEFAQRRGLVAERGFFNPGRREGLKIAYLEAAEQIPRPIDWYVQAVSSAMGVIGAWKGAKELLGIGKTTQLPRLLCVQQDTCDPLVRAFAANSPVIRPKDIVSRPTGIAEAILRGNPTKAYPYVRQAVLESEGTACAVSEAEIRQARRMLFEHEGIDACFSASTALAGLFKQVREGIVPRGDTIFVNLTGRDRAREFSPMAVHWLSRGVSGWEPEDPANERTRAAWLALC